MFREVDKTLWDGFRALTRPGCFSATQLSRRPWPVLPKTVGILTKT